MTEPKSAGSELEISGDRLAAALAKTHISHWWKQAFLLILTSSTAPELRRLQPAPRQIHK
jgi:hypothetical protein